MKILNLEKSLEIHALVIQKTGGSDGLRDLGRLKSVIASQAQVVFDEELYDTECDKSAAIIRGMVLTVHSLMETNALAY